MYPSEPMYPSDHSGAAADAYGVTANSRRIASPRP